MSEKPSAQKRDRSDDSSVEEPKFQASASGLHGDNHLQLSIDEGIRQLLRCRVASKGSILSVLDAMRAEIIGSSEIDKHSLRLFLPDEVLLDILVYLDRLSLEKLQYTCRRFRTIVDLRMTDVCYRVIDYVHIRREQLYGNTITAWIGKREHGGSLHGTRMLTSEVSEHGERTAIFASMLDDRKDHIADVLTNMCRHANVLVYKISGEALSSSGFGQLRENWPRLVPVNANRMTVSEFVLDRCTVRVPSNGSISRETIVMRMLESFRRVHGFRFIVEIKPTGIGADDRNIGFTDRFLEFCAKPEHEIDSISLDNWDKGISERGVVDFLLDAPSDRCKRELSFSSVRGVTASFYDALIKASTECATAHTSSLHVRYCDSTSLPQHHIREADDEDWGAWGDREYRFFRGLLPFSIASERSFFSYKRDDAGYYEDEPEDDERAQDNYEDHDSKEEEDGNDAE